MNRKGLARISSQPGKTQTINFYNINNSMYLVDLPGYGYAKANVEIKAKWGQMIEHYLHVSKKLRAVFLLIDLRHDPSENDCLMYDWIRAQGFAPIIIATKADKLKRSQIPAHVQAIRDVLRMDEDAIVIPFSAETKQGREEIWELVDSLVELPAHDSQREENCAGKPGKAGEPQGKFASPQEQEKHGEEEQTQKKPRWKKTERPVAKKTAKKRKQKKAAGKKR